MTTESKQKRSSRERCGKNNKTNSKSLKHKMILKKDVAIASSNKNTKWKVMSHIGAGGFGDVYMVHDINETPDTPYAMKTEMNSANLQRLHIEKQILKEISDYCAAQKKPKHFCELVDNGNTKLFIWIIMTLIGPSLDSVRRMLKKQFSLPTVINIGLQTLEALEILHEVGFIHRDLKPGNICVGVPPKDDRTLYLLDFGISRRIYKSATNKTLRKERDHVPFFGTRKFCSRACHNEKDQGRRDDIEVWIYTVLDLFHNEKGLPWATVKDQTKAVDMKISLFKNPETELNSIIPTQFTAIIKYVGTLGFLDPINYKLIEGELKAIAKEKKYDLDDLLDWEKKLTEMIEARKTNKISKKASAVISGDGNGGTTCRNGTVSNANNNELKHSLVTQKGTPRTVSLTPALEKNTKVEESTKRKGVTKQASTNKVVEKQKSSARINERSNRKTVKYEASKATQTVSDNSKEEKKPKKTEKKENKSKSQEKT